MNYTNKFRPGRTISWSQFATVILLLLAFSAGLHASELFYVYTDRHGKTIMEDRLSDDARRYGYKIVNASGVTLQSVGAEPAATLGGKKRLSSNNDWMLLQSYSKEDEIVAAKKRRLTSIKGMIEIASSNMSTFQKNLDQMQERRTQLDASAPNIAKLDKDIATVQNQVKQFREQVAKLTDDYELTGRRFDEDLKRFKELRQSLHAK